MLGRDAEVPAQPLCVPDRPVGSAGPNGSTPNDALDEVRETEKEKKDAFGVTLTRGDGIRRSQMLIGGGAKPPWATSYDGVLIESRLPVIMPYAEMVMGQTPRIYGHKHIPALAFIPMDKEPSDPLSDEYDNNGVASGGLLGGSKSDIGWDDMDDETF